jgi:hypothetical protein
VMQRRRWKRRKRPRRSVGRQRNPYNTSLLSSLSIQLSIEHRLQLHSARMERNESHRLQTGLIFHVHTQTAANAPHTARTGAKWWRMTDDGGRGHTSQYFK